MRDMYTLHPLPKATRLTGPPPPPNADLRTPLNSLSQSFPNLFQTINDDRDAVVTWATKIVDCKSFILPLPDLDEPRSGKERGMVCMYMRLWEPNDANGNGDRDGNPKENEGWMFKELELPPTRE
jgi:hypothetical protein